MSAPIMNMTNSMDTLVSSFNAAEAAINGIDEGGINKLGSQIDLANIAAERLNQTFNMVDDIIRNNDAEQQKFNETLRKTQGLSSGILGSLGKLGAMVGGFMGIRALTSVIPQAFGRIDTMEQFKRTITTMTGDVDRAKVALDNLTTIVTGTAYGLDTAAAATQGFLTRGMGLEAATKQVQAWGDAVAFYGQGTSEQLETVADAIGRIYSRGKVDQMQLNRLTMVGINATQMYADAVGRSTADVQADLSSGKISAVDFINTVTKAIETGNAAGAAKNAGNSWANTFTNTRAAIARGWQALIEGIENTLNDSGLPTFKESILNMGKAIESTMKAIGPAVAKVGIAIGSALSAVVKRMQVVVAVATQISNAIKYIAGYFTAVWPFVAPIIQAVAEAMILYMVAVQLSAKWTIFLERATKIFKGTLFLFQSGLAIATHGWKAYKDGALIATGAQLGFNTALALCPLVWIIMGIIAIVGALTLASNAMQAFGYEGFSVAGVIIGALGTVFMFLMYNVFAAADTLLGFLSTILNAFIGFSNGVRNLVDSPSSFLAVLIHGFAGMGQFCLSVLKSIAKGMDWVLGGSKADTIQDWQDELQVRADLSASKYGRYKQYTKPIDLSLESLTGIQRKGYGEGYHLIYDGVKAWQDSKNVFNNLAQDTEMPDFGDLEGLLGGIEDFTGETAANTGKMAGMAEDSLKFLREMAEQKVLSRITTIEINVKQDVHNNLKSDMDIDGVVGRLCDDLSERLAVSMEGVTA